MHAHAALHHSPQRPAYPDVPRMVETTDRRTREMADEMVRQNAEEPGGCTEASMLLAGFSFHEQKHLGPTARQIATGKFVRQDHHELQPLSDEEVLAIALNRTGGLVDAGQIVAALRGDLALTPDRIARIWPQLMVRLAAGIAKLPVPGAREFARGEL